MTDNSIWHGDSEELVHKLPTGIGCVVTDPPYGMAFKSNRATTSEGKEFTKAIANDDNLEGALAKFTNVMTPIIPKMVADSDLYVFTKWDLMQPWTDAINDLGVQVRMMIVWEKGYPGMGDLTYNWGCGHEVILYAKRGKRPVHHRRSAIIHVDKVPAQQNTHPTEKPVQLLEELIAMSTDPDDLVVDPFSGSGSTSVAAQRLGRNSIGIEIEEKYVESSRSRLSALSFDFF